MMLTAARLLVAIWALAFTWQAAHADKRVALVIGNAAYHRAPALATPTNDAKEMANTLADFGFEVILGLDLDKRAMDRKVSEFTAALPGAEAAVLYYSGYGLQMAGVNYLLPLDAELVTPAAFDHETVSLDPLQRAMEHEVRSGLIFLDACRESPLRASFARAAGIEPADMAPGLAPMEPGPGMLVSISAQPGMVAPPDDGKNSPYSAALIDTISAADEDALPILTAVKEGVEAASGGKQIPWHRSALRASFYFYPITPGDVPTSEDAKKWSAMQGEKAEAARKQFVTRFPDSVYAALARAQLGALRRAAASLKAGSLPPPPKQPPPPKSSETKAPQPKEPAQEASPPPKQQPPKEACADGKLAVGQEKNKPLCLKAGSGENFKDCPQCPEMVLVPAGSFQMGSSEHEPQREANEGPQHEVTVEKPFAVSRFPVTFDEWKACVAGGGCGGYKPSDDGFWWGRSTRPAVNVSWNDAKAYVKWLSEKTGMEYRLLSEADREYVTRAGTAGPFWWGASITTDEANYFGKRSYNGGREGEYRFKTLDVNSFKPNPWGLYQVHGNIWEWVEDCWNADYSGAPATSSPVKRGDCSLRVIRGGSRDTPPEQLRSACRGRSAPGQRNNTLGFRVARTIAP